MNADLIKSGNLLKFTTDLDLRIISSNLHAGRNADKSLQPCEGATLFQLLPSFDVAQVERIKSVCLHAPFQSQKLVVRHAVNGHARNFTWMVCALLNRDGVPKGLQWVGVDSTAPQSREEHLVFHQAVLQHVSEAVTIFDANGVITDFNKKAEEVFNLRAENVIGRPVGTLFSFQPANAPWKAVMAQLQQTGLWQGVMQVQSKSGQLVYTENQTVAVKDETGVLLGYFSIDRDITKQYLQEQQQQQITLQTVLQGLMNHTGAFAWAIDAQGYIRYANATVSKTFGIKPEVENTHLRELIAAEKLPVVEDHCRTVIEEGAIINQVAELPVAVFNKKKFRSLKFPLYTKKGTLAAGFAYEVSKERQHDEEMAYLKQRYELAVNIIADVITDWDIENNRLWRSNPCSRMEVHPRHASTLEERFSRVHPDDLDRFRSSLQKAIDSGADTWECAYRYKSGRVEGAYKVLQEKAIILRNKEGKAIRMISAVQDLTEQRKLEEELEQKEKAVIAATIEGQEAERSELARELHDNVGQVLAMCKLFVDIAADSVQHEYLDKCRHHLERAIGEIRSLSHRLSPETLSRKGLAAAVNDLVENINQTGKLQIKLVLCCGIVGTDLPRNVQTTAYRIVQECIANILKHAQAGKAEISLKLKNGSLLIEVSDDGNGFDTKKASSGIGLKNIRNRIELCGGKLHLSSAPGKGCKLSVQLPLAA